MALNFREKATSISREKWIKWPVDNAYRQSSKKVLQFCLEHTFRLKCLYAEYYYLFDNIKKKIKKNKKIPIQLNFEKW